MFNKCIFKLYIKFASYNFEYKYSRSLIKVAMRVPVKFKYFLLDVLTEKYFYPRNYSFHFSL